MKLTFKVPPSSTEQTIVIDVPDSITAPVQTVPINYGTIQLVITGTTPIPATPDPVEPIPVPTGYKLIYENDFNEPGDLDPFGTGQAGNGYIDNGQFHSRPKDGVSGGTRSEIQLRLAIPQEGRVEYDATYLYVVKDACHSVQFHPSTDGGSASPGLWHVGGYFWWYNWIKGTNYKYPTSVLIPVNKKMHFVVDFKFGPGGYLKHSIDGKVVLDKTNIQVGDNTATTFKLGFNGGWGGVSEALKSDILFDNLKVYQKI